MEKEKKAKVKQLRKLKKSGTVAIAALESKGDTSVESSRASLIDDRAIDDVKVMKHDMKKGIFKKKAADFDT